MFDIDLALVEEMSLLEQGKELGIKQGKEEGIKEGKEKGEYNKAIKVAKRLLNKNFSIEEIAEYTELPIEEIIKLKKS